MRTLHMNSQANALRKPGIAQAALQRLLLVDVTMLDQCICIGKRLLADLAYFITYIEVRLDVILEIAFG